MGDERHIDDVPPNAAPRLNKDFDPAGAELSPEDYFVMTRVDGRTPLRQLVLISGFPEPRTRAILGKLRERGAILFPGDVPRPAAPPPPPPTSPQPLPAIIDVTADPRLQEDVELTPEQRRLILSRHANMRQATFFEVLDVPRDASKRDVKAAYRRLSKDFHPDRFFGRRLGSFKELLSEIFDLASQALITLSDDAARESYLEELEKLNAPAVVNDPTSGPLLRTPPLGGVYVSPTARRAAELFEEACLHHVSTGQLERSLAEFAEAIALDPQPRYLRRAAEASLKAQRLREAEEYAKKATELDANNAASHRILGRVLAEAGRPHEARAALVRALRIDPTNPHIAAELRGLDEQAR